MRVAATAVGGLLLLLVIVGGATALLLLPSIFFRGGFSSDAAFAFVFGLGVGMRGRSQRPWPGQSIEVPSIFVVGCNISSDYALRKEKKYPSFCRGPRTLRFEARRGAHTRLLPLCVPPAVSRDPPSPPRYARRWPGNASFLLPSTRCGDSSPPANGPRTSVLREKTPAEAPIEVTNIPPEERGRMARKVNLSLRYTTCALGMKVGMQQ